MTNCTTLLYSKTVTLWFNTDTVNENDLVTLSIAKYDRIKFTYRQCCPVDSIALGSCNCVVVDS